MYVSDLGRVEGDCIFSREDFFPFRSSPSSSHVTLRRNNLVNPSYKTICQTNPRPKFSMNQRTIYIVAKFQNPKNSNPCDNNNLFSRREGEKRKRRRIRTKKQFAYNGWKTGNNRLGIFVPRRLSAGMEWGKGGYWCSSDKICRFSIRASITCTPNSGTCWWLRSRERGLDRV